MFCKWWTFTFERGLPSPVPLVSTIHVIFVCFSYNVLFPSSICQIQCKTEATRCCKQRFQLPHSVGLCRICSWQLGGMIACIKKSSAVQLHSYCLFWYCLLWEYIIIIINNIVITIIITIIIIIIVLLFLLCYYLWDIYYLLFLLFIFYFIILTTMSHVKSVPLLLPNPKKL